MKVKKYFNIQGPCDPARHYIMTNEKAVAAAAACLKNGGLYIWISPKGTGKTTFLRQCYEMIGSSTTVISLNLVRREGETGQNFKTLLMTRLYEALYYGEILNPSKKLTAWIKLQKIRIGEEASELEDSRWFLDLQKMCSKPLIMVLENVDGLRADTGYQTFMHRMLENTALGRYARFSLLLTGCTQVLPIEMVEKTDRGECAFAQAGVRFEKLPVLLRYDKEKIKVMLIAAGVSEQEAEVLGEWLEEMTDGHAGLIVKIVQGMQRQFDRTGINDWSVACGMQSVAEILQQIYPVNT